MSSLPMISHHLYAAAVGNDHRVQREPAHSHTMAFDAPASASAVPLEVLDSAYPMPDRSVRRLTPSIAATRTT